MEQFSLKPHEKQSALWQKLQQHLESRLDIQRKKNDGNHDLVNTAKIRGRIAEIKSLLSLGDGDSDGQEPPEID